MAHNRIVCAASPERAFAVLEDPRPYAYFVAGTRAIRRFDPRWPEPGSLLHHSLGFVLTLIRDTTEVVAIDPPRQLVLSTRLRPLAVNETIFRLAPAGGGTAVEIEERPVEGPAALPLVAPVADRLLWLRNSLLLRRLRKVIEGRERWRATQVAGAVSEPRVEARP